jgi:hypothetical protein
MSSHLPLAWIYETNKITLFNILDQYKIEDPEDINGYQPMLREMIFTFNSVLSLEEKELFEYNRFGYVEPNPGLNDDQVYSSYVGDHISDSGVHSGHSGEHS